MIIKKKKMIMKIMLCSHFHTAHRINVKFGPASMIILKIGITFQTGHLIS